MVTVDSRPALQHVLKGQPAGLTPSPQCWPVDRTLLVAVPVRKQLPLKVEHLTADFGARPCVLGDGGCLASSPLAGEIADDVHPAQAGAAPEGYGCRRRSDHSPRFPRRPPPNSSIAAAVERLSPCKNTVTTGVCANEVGRRPRDLTRDKDPSITAHLPASFCNTLVGVCP